MEGRDLRYPLVGEFLDGRSSSREIQRAGEPSAGVNEPRRAEVTPAEEFRAQNMPLQAQFDSLVREALEVLPKVVLRAEPIVNDRKLDSIYAVRTFSLAAAVGEMTSSGELSEAYCQPYKDGAVARLAALRESVQRQGLLEPPGVAEQLQSRGKPASFFLVRKTALSLHGKIPKEFEGGSRGHDPRIGPTGRESRQKEGRAWATESNATSNQLRLLWTLSDCRPS